MRDSSLTKGLYYIGMLCIVIVFTLPIAILTQIISLPLYFDLLGIMLCIVVLLFIIALVTRFAVKHTDRGVRMIRMAIRNAVVSGVVLFFSFATFPTISSMTFWQTYRACERDLNHIGDAVQRYIEEEHTVPNDLSMIIEKGYLDKIPKFNGTDEYLYRVVEDEHDIFFVIDCPCPDVFTQSNGIVSKGKKYIAVQYIQNRGFSTVTE